MPAISPLELFHSRLPAWRSALLIAMLALLYLVLWQPAGSYLAKTVFVAHMGLFILWQPFIEGGQKLAPQTVFLLGLIIGAAAYFLTGGLLMLWIMLLAGIVGGKVLLSGERSARLLHLFALAFLVVALLLDAVPQAFTNIHLPEPLFWAGRFGLPALLLAMLAMPQKLAAVQSAEVVDFINSVFIFLVLAVLVLGSLAAMLLLRSDYATALLQALIILGCVLLVLGWAWSPHLGFSGVESIFSRYLMSVGLPAEQWLHSLADLAIHEDDPEAFVALSCAELARQLPWIAGVTWTSDGVRGEQGLSSGNHREFRQQAVTLTIYTRYPLPPSLVWHISLLAQLLAEFHADKKRARQLSEMSYLQAVHETGARLTHDVKNLLQSLQTLCRAADEDGADTAPEFHELLRRQLPVIASRLGATLGKLQIPFEDGVGHDQLAVKWWSEARQRHADNTWIRFEPALLQPSFKLPVAVFSSVLDNLIGNATEKRAHQPGLSVSITLKRDGDGMCLVFCDDGEPIEPSIAARLLRGPVPSASGLGIGLFQATRLAEQSAYVLSIEDNRRGHVCFSLAPAGRSGLR